MRDPRTLNRDQLIAMAQGQKSMIANLQAQLRKALESNAALYAEKLEQSKACQRVVTTSGNEL